MFMRRFPHTGIQVVKIPRYLLRVGKIFIMYAKRMVCLSCFYISANASFIYNCTSTLDIYIYMYNDTTDYLSFCFMRLPFIVDF